MRGKKMIPYVVFDHLSIGPLNFYTWGFFVGLAFAAGYFLTLYRAKRKNIPPEKIFWLALAIFFGAALGSRVAFLLQEPQRWLADVSLLWRINQGGLMLWGGILGAILFGWLYIKIVKLNSPHPNPLLTKERERVRFPFWILADLATPAIALGIGIGRIGCFLINDHLGTPTNLPWGILWPDGIVRHPVALYESLAGFGLFIVFWFLQKKLLFERASAESRTVSPVIPAKAGIQNSWIPGQTRDDKSHGGLFLLFLLSYSVLRFFLDFLRASDGILADPRWWGLTSSQWVSLVIFLVVTLLFIFNKKGERII